MCYRKSLYFINKNVVNICFLSYYVGIYLISLILPLSLQSLNFLLAGLFQEMCADPWGK